MRKHETRQDFNLHTHTSRCGHAEGLDIQYVNSAIDAGFKLLGFSEHIPFKGMCLPECRMLYERKDFYVREIRELQENFKDKIQIKVGYEVEYSAQQYSHLLAMRKECDYMILGQHLKYFVYDYDCYCSNEDVGIYAKQIEEALSKGFITYVAHPDYFMLGRRSFTKECVKAAHRIAKASIQYDVPLEINLNGFRYGKKNYQFYNKEGVYEERYPYPFREFWEIISSYGCKVLYGYDAHSPITLLEREREQIANDILEGLTLNFIDEVEIK